MSKEIHIRLSAVCNGYPVEVRTTGSIDQVPAMTKRLRELGCTPPGQPTVPAAPAPTRTGSSTGNGKRPPRYDVNGHPCCPYHDAPLVAGQYGYFCPEKHPAAGGPVDKKGYCGYRVKFAEVDQ